jgi:hypothetical protein
MLEFQAATTKKFSWMTELRARMTEKLSPMFSVPTRNIGVILPNARAPSGNDREIILTDQA